MNFNGVADNEKNILDISLKYSTDIQFIISSNNIKKTKDFYKQNNIDIDNNLITTLETFSNTYHTQLNNYDSIFHSIIFFSKIINKLYSKDNIKYVILFCISKKHVQRAVVLTSNMFKNILSIKFIYDNNEQISVEDTLNENYQLGLFFQSIYYKK